MNVRTQLARVIHNQVVNESLVDSHLLLDDDNYGKLITKLINSEENMVNLNSESIKNELLNYVNNNY